VEAEIKSEFPDIEITLVECGFGTFKVFLDDETIFRKLPVFGSFPSEGEITEKIQEKINSLET
tara:strand:- start:104 stop:292 length:189 start_codon:yes stop_codon:yes gene_type:complete